MTTVDKKLQLYTQQMELIKRRIEVVDSIIKKKSHSTPYEASNIELCCLQLRKCIELIVMSSLVANSETYLEMYNRLGRDWKVPLISKDLERINPNFYPTPIRIIPHEDRPDEFIKFDDGNYISCNALLDYYEKIGAIMHSENPFGNPIDYSEYEMLIRRCRDEIINLLNVHLAHLSDGKSMLYVVMQSNKDKKVHITYFQIKSEEATTDDKT